MSLTLISVLHGTALALLFVISWPLMLIAAVLIFTLKFILNPRFLKTKHRPFPPPCLIDSTLGRHGFVDSSQGIRIHFVEKGDRSNPLILFVHGFPEFWFAWRHQLREFSKDYWAVSIDLRGYGESSKPTGVSNYTSEKLAEDLRHVIKSLGREEAILISHDFGAIVVWKFIELYPEMVTSFVTINGPHPGIYHRMLRAPRQMLKSWYLLAFQVPFFPELLLTAHDSEILRIIVMETSATQPQVAAEELEAYKYTLGKREALRGPINFYRAVLRSHVRKVFLGEPLICTDWGPAPPPPGLFIFGEADTFIEPTIVELTRATFSNVQTTVIPGAGHFLEHQDYVVVNRALRQFLVGCGGGSGNAIVLPRKVVQEELDLECTPLLKEEVSDLLPMVHRDFHASTKTR